MSYDITLTFDNGPTEAVTPHVLDVLARHGIRASFFVLGKNLQTDATRAMVDRAAAAGHWIGNHTFTHSVPLGLTEGPDVARHEITDTQALIEHVSSPRRFFRPFGGGGKIGPHLLSPSALSLLQEGRYTCVLWNSIPHDWDDPHGWVETALAQCRAQPWSVVVLHDYDTGAMVHLERFIERARADGARFRQDFPPECVPLEQGVATQSLAPFTAA